MGTYKEAFPTIKKKFIFGIFWIFFFVPGFFRFSLRQNSLGIDSFAKTYGNKKKSPFKNMQETGYANFNTYILMFSHTWKRFQPSEKKVFFNFFGFFVFV